MPALYRMPVFYMAALLLAVAIGLGAWSRSVSAPQSPTGTTREPPAAVPAPPARATEESVGEPPADGILRTPDGLRRKVVIQDLDVVCRTEPVQGQPVGPPLDEFAIRFLYGEWPADHPTAFAIGPREGPAQGWVPASSVLEWDTRLMARPTPRGGRPALRIYRERACLLEALAHRACPRHQGRCPTEGEEGPSGPQGQQTPLGMPILRSREVREPDGSTRTIFEVASLVRDLAPPPPPPAVPPPDLQPALKRLEIAFAIDTTASMQATIDAARRLAARLVATASTRYGDVTLRLGLVEYRDSGPAFGFTSRIVTRFTDPTGFRAALERLKAAPRGDGTIEEAVLDGVATALPPAPDERPGSDHLDWPTGPRADLATRMLVVLGDAPDHDRDLARVHALAARARRSGISIATIALDRPGVLSRAERARYQAQWQALAEGSYRPLDKASGFTTTIPPAFFPHEQADRLDRLLQVLIDDRVERARHLAALAAAEAEGRLTEYVTSQGLTLDRIAPVLVDLHRGQSAAEAQSRPDPRAHGRKAPSVRRGWIAERVGGVPLVTVEVLMSRAELGILIDELTRFQQAIQGSARDLSDLLRIGTAAASGETSFLAVDRGVQTFADHLRRRQGLPPARPDSLLRRTQSDLLQADDIYRAALNARVGDSLIALIRRRDAHDWSDPRRTIDGMAPVPYALIDY